MSYSYFDNNNNINKLNFDQFQVGKKWSEVKTNNKELDSIFTSKRVDVNQDGKIDENEVGLLKAFLKLADGILGAKPNESESRDGFLKNEELAELNKQLKNKESQTIEVKKGEVPPKLEDYNYIETSKLYNGEDFAFTTKVVASNFDTTELDPGKYYLQPDKLWEGSYLNITPLKIQDESKGTVTNWSEGMNREIGTIRLADYTEILVIDEKDPQKTKPNDKLKIVTQEMQDIGKEVGFDVQIVHTNTLWIEDTHIRRHDGSVYIPNSSDEFNKSISKDNFIEGITSRRSSVSRNDAQGSIAKKGAAKEYAKTVAETDKYQGESYLEGGNVLNTLRADNTPGAIVGDESVDYTLKLLKLDKTETNVMIAKNKIAQDLGLKPDEVTFIPQFDFHIDMGYRQFESGEIAIPDYKAGIEYLENTNIESMDPNTKQKLIAELKRIQGEIGSIIDESEDALNQGGYKVVKLPCFSTTDRFDGLPKINFMNGVAGTSSERGTVPKGTTYYITNKSNFPEINDYMANYLKDNMGVNKTYFVSTTSFLDMMGGIDCLTEEYGK